MLKKSCKKVSKNIDFLMAWTLLIEAGACTRARFSTFQPTTKNHQKSIPKWSNFGIQIDEQSIKNWMPKSDRKNDAKSDAKRRPRDPHLEAQTKKIEICRLQNGAPKPSLWPRCSQDGPKTSKSPKNIKKLAKIETTNVKKYLK